MQASFCICTNFFCRVIFFQRKFCRKHVGSEVTPERVVELDRSRRAFGCNPIEVTLETQAQAQTVLSHEAFFRVGTICRIYHSCLMGLCKYEISSRHKNYSLFLFRRENCNFGSVSKTSPTPETFSNRC